MTTTNELAQQTARAFVLAYEALPADVKREIKRQIDEILEPATTSGLDWSGFKTAAFHAPDNTYGRDELYDDDRV